ARQSRVVDTESNRPATGSITGSSELGVSCSMYQRNRSRPAKPGADESYMALTFGTLLSSQGADAHRQDPFGPIGGNPSYVTRSVPHGQTRPTPPRLPLGRGDSKSLGASCLGEST